MNRIIKPMINAIIAFNRGPPGALIKRAKLGLMNADIPIIITIIPTMSKMVFVKPIIPPFLFNYYMRV